MLLDKHDFQIKEQSSGHSEVSKRRIALTVLS